jgi:MFS family permease
MSSTKFFDIINNKILFVLTILYIIIGFVAFKFGDFTSATSDIDKSGLLECQLDNIDDEFRSTRSRSDHFFIKNKTAIYNTFGIIGFLSLLIAWAHNIRVFNFKNSKKDIDLLPNNYFKIIGFIITFTLIILGLFAGIFYLFSYTPTILTILLNIINLLIIASIIALFYEQLPGYISAIGVGILTLLFFGLSIGWKSGLILAVFGLIIGYVAGKHKKEKKIRSPVKDFIYAVLLSLPCLIINISLSIGNSIYKEHKNNNNKSWLIILSIIVFLIILKLILPFIYKTIIKYTLPVGNILIDNPISLHNSNSLGKFQSLKQQEDNSMHENTFLNYNYALSMQLWIFPQSSATSSAYNKPTSLVNISNLIDIKFNNNNLEFWATTTDSKTREKLVKIYIFKNFKFQRWNNIIVNYHGGTLDIFINKILVSSTPNIVPLSDISAATVGSENGIYGGIKNVVYYKDILTQQQINIINNFS